MIGAVFVAATLLTIGSDGAAQSAGEVIAEIRVHGNLIVPSDDVIKLAGVNIGDPFGPTTIADVTARLRASKKFHEIRVLKRYASIADPTRVSLVLIVNEGSVRIDMPDQPSGPVRVVKRRALGRLMFMPILDGEDGYGLTYGARLAYPGAVGPQSRISFPLTWGGMKRAGAEIDRSFDRGPIGRVSGGGAIQRQQNPAYLANDDRRRIWGRVERVDGPFRIGSTAAWQRVSFLGETDRVRSFGADVAFDTRLDPILPRNAVYAIASWERLWFDSRDPIDHTRVEGRGYIGLFNQTVLALRAARDDANRPLPLYFRRLLGGWSNLRGFKAGSFTGDTLVTASAEFRVPLSSPLDVAKVGVSVFVDTGTVYDKTQRYRDQPHHTGIGGSFWMTAAVFQMSLSVAHGRGADTRVNFGLGSSF